jgi:hypothetical protein
MNTEVNNELVKKFEEFYSLRKPGIEVIKANEASALKAARQIFINYWWKKDDELYKLMQAQLDRIILETNKTTKLGNPTPGVTEYEVGKLVNMIMGLRKTATSEIHSILKKWVIENPQIPQEEKSKFLDNTKYVQLYMNAAKEKINQMLERMTYDYFKAYTKIFKFNKEALARIVRLITFQTPRLLSETVTNAIRNGRNATLIEKGAGWIIMHNIIIPSVVSFIQNTWDNLNRMIDRPEIKKMKIACDAAKQMGIDVEGCPTEEEYKKAMASVGWDDFVNQMQEKSPVLRWINLAQGEKFSPWKDPFFWTYWDEIASVAKKITYSNEFENVFDKDQMLKVTDDVKSKVGRKLKELGINATDNMEDNVIQYRKKLLENQKNKATDSTNNAKQDLPFVTNLKQDTPSNFSQKDSAAAAEFFKQ